MAEPSHLVLFNFRRFVMFKPIPISANQEIFNKRSALKQNHIDICYLTDICLITVEKYFIIMQSACTICLFSLKRRIEIFDYISLFCLSTVNSAKSHNVATLFSRFLCSNNTLTKSIFKATFLLCFTLLATCYLSHSWSFTFIFLPNWLL